MKKLLAATVLGLALLGLTGCSWETLEERIVNRDQCEDAGGLYYEGVNSYGEYAGWFCDLSTVGEGN